MCDRKIVNENVCVVGGAGFLGSHLVNYLIEERKCNVLVIDNLVAGRREFVHPQANFVHHDITGSEHYLKNLFESLKINYVFNYAAWPYIPSSFSRPLHVADVNFMGALKVINAAQEAGVKGILQVSSAEIYGEGQRVNTGLEEGEFSADQPGKISEYAKVVPHSSYGASKAAVDAMVQVRWKEAKTPCIALRQFNCIGERETHSYVVPEIISQLSQRKFDKDTMCSFVEDNSPPPVFLGNNSFRDLQYAGDAVAMAVELLERGEFGEVYNMGSEEGIKIYDLAKLIGELMGFNEVQVVEDPDRIRPWEIWHLQSDNSKLYSVIEHRPQVTLREALRFTILDFNTNGRKWCWQ